MVLPAMTPVAAGPPATAIEVGDKAAGLLELARVGAGGRFAVPLFRVMAPESLARYHGRFGPVPAIPAGFCPDPAGTPPGARRFFAAFPRMAATDIATCLEAIPGPVVIRTSLVGSPAAGGSACGINCTGLARRPADVAVVLPELLAGLYRPYTDWCLGPAAGDRRRLAALVFMAAVPFRLLGAAYVGEDIHIEVERRRDPGRPADVERIPAAGSRPPGSRLLPAAALEAVVDAARHLQAGLGPRGWLEIEFLVDGAGRLFVIQAREISPGAGVFHSPGRAEGPLLDLRGRSRSPATVAALTAALAAGGTGDRPVVVIRAVDDRGFDAFALGWQLRVGALRTLPVPAALVLVHPRPRAPAESPHPGGFRNHLARALQEMVPATMVVQVEEPGVTPGVGGLRLASDGVSLSLAAC